MKIINIYRIIVVFLSICFFTTLILYKNKTTVIIKEEKILNPNYVFLGDSITDYYDLDKYYSNMPVVNSGISGNRVRDILNNLEDRVYRYNPSKVIILIGINDFIHEYASSDSVYNNIEKIADNIRKRCKNCKIYIESIYPINDDWRLYHQKDTSPDYELKDKIENTNKKIKKICKKNKYKYIDVFKTISDENGYFDRKYTDDGLHPNDNGYKIITKEIKKVLNE